MSIRRVQVSSTDGEVMTLPINPINFDDPLDAPNVVRTIDGFSSISYSKWDGTVKTLEWQNLPNKAPYTNLLSILNTLPGTTGTIILNDLSGSITDTVVQNVVWISLDKKIAYGPASATAAIKYEYIKLSYSLI
jgi:hypothetical protein